MSTAIDRLRSLERSMQIYPYLYPVFWKEGQPVYVFGPLKPSKFQREAQASGNRLTATDEALKAGTGKKSGIYLRIFEPLLQKSQQVRTRLI